METHKETLTIKESMITNQPQTQESVAHHTSQPGYTRNRLTRGSLAPIHVVLHITSTPLDHIRSYIFLSFSLSHTHMCTVTRTCARSPRSAPFFHSSRGAYTRARTWNLLIGPRQAAAPSRHNIFPPHQRGIIIRCKREQLNLRARGSHFTRSFVWLARRRELRISSGGMEEREMIAGMRCGVNCRGKYVGD